MESSAESGALDVILVGVRGEENPVLAQMDGEEVRASELGRHIFQTHRAEAMASLSKLIGLRIADRESRRLGVRPDESRISQHRADLLRDLEKEAVITFGVGTGPEVLTKARFGMDVESYLARQTDEERERRLLSHLIRYHGRTEERIEVLLIATRSQAVMDEVTDRLGEGADFGRLAERRSEDSSARLGGKLPPLPRVAFETPIADILFGLKVGDRSGVLSVPLPDGTRQYQIFKVVAHHAAEAVAYGDVASSIEADIAARPISKDEWAAWYLAMERLYKVRLSPTL
jgi:parvulin-like peptidyl-prolyl isomerase